MADETDFFNPPAEGDTAAFAAPPADDHVGEVFAPGVEDNAFAAPPTPVESGDAPIILGEPAPYEAPPADDGMGFAAAAAPAPEGVENVSDDEAEMAEAPTTLVSAEPTAMTKWNEEWQTTLLARKDEENSIKAAAVEKAREDIASFQAEREKRRESRMAKNRSDEQDKLEAIEADLENDNSWQRVVKMIELNQDSSDGAVDTGRMKDVLVLLKNEPTMADALGA